MFFLNPIGKQQFFGNSNNDAGPGKGQEEGSTPS